jgi:cell division septal protein FtsQ
MVRRQLLVGALVFLGLGLVLTAIWYGTRVERWQLQTVEVIGGVTISHTVVEKAVAEQLDGTYYRLIPRTFFWLYPHDAIVAQLSALPRLQEVRLERVGASKLVVAFTEYEPQALWCATGATECIFLDHTGYAFAAAPDLIGSALVRYELPIQTPEVGTNPFTDEVFDTTQTFIDELKERLNLYVIGVELDAADDVVYRLADGAELKVSHRLPVATTVANLEILLQNESFDHLAGGSFDYIDLRFGDKMFVAEEEYVATSSATSTATTSIVTE